MDPLDYTLQLQELLDIMSNIQFVLVGILFAVGMVIGNELEKALVPWNR